MKPGNPVNHRITGFDHPTDTNNPGTYNRRSENVSPGFRVSGSLFSPSHTQLVQQISDTAEGAQEDDADTRTPTGRPEGQLTDE